MSQIIKVEGYGDFEFPDDTDDDTIQEAIGREIANITRTTSSQPQEVRGGERSFDAFQDVAETSPIVNEFAKREPNIDYHTGVRDVDLRTGLSRMDTEEEKTKFLNEKVGSGKWERDKWGQFIISPAGMEGLGLEHKGLPVAVDEHRSTPLDVADWRGDAPAIAGAVAGGMATGGAGILPAMGMAGLSAAGFQGFDEALDAIRQQNLQSPEEVGTGLLTKAAEASAGEAVHRGLLRPLGRKILAPEASRMTPQSTMAMEDALRRGFAPKVSQISRPPILGRMEEVAEKLFGAPSAEINRKAILKNLELFRAGQGPKGGLTSDLGITISDSIEAGRKKFGDRASALYSKVDELAGGRAVVPTASLKKSAVKLFGDLPKTIEGKPAFTSPETQKFIDEILSLPDNLTVGQMQAVRSRLFDTMYTGDLVPGITSRQVKQLYKGATTSFDDIARQEGGGEVAKQLNLANRYYRQNIKKFDDHLIEKIVRDPAKAGGIDPENIVDVVFHRGTGGTIRRVKRVVEPEVWQKFERQTMDDLLDNIVDKTKDPLQDVFNGKKFLNGLDAMGKEKLNAMFGSTTTKELYEFGRAVNLVSSKPPGAAGGLVAAYVALHPLQNIGVLAKMKVIQKLLTSETGRKWFTTGLKAPKTRAGADAISRLTVMIQQLADEETNAPLINYPFSEQEIPQ